jgi:hypothetical protein
MACSIQITGVTGKRTASSAYATSVTISGTAQECREVRVALICASYIDQVVPVDPQNGKWSVEFTNLALLKCACQGTPGAHQISLRAICEENPGCSVEGNYWLPCQYDCPTVIGINQSNDLPKKPQEEIPACLDDPVQGTFTFTPNMFPSGPGTFTWDFGDGTTGSGIAVNHTYPFPSVLPYTVTVKFEPSTPGCEVSTATLVLNVPKCPPTPPPPPPNGNGDKDGDGDQTPPPPPPPSDGDGDKDGDKDKDDDDDDKKKDDDGGGFNFCAALLIAALLMFVGGTLLLAYGLCYKLAWAIGVGIAGAVVGFGLFILWTILCSRSTPCPILQVVWCFLLISISIGGIAAGILAWILTKDPLCAAAFFGAVEALGIPFGWLTVLMNKINCKPSCFGL